MSNWNRLLCAMDAEYRIPNAVASTAKKTGQFYDPKTHEHVFTLEYRVRVIPQWCYRPTEADSLLGSILGNP